MIGRFAPSPSGPLHFGSVVTAVASYLDARAAGGRWLLRIDDLDPARIEAGATVAILRTVEALALTWDGPVVYQSARGPAYAEALAQLRGDRHTYPCSCSRREIGAGPYPGTCRLSAQAPTRAAAERVVVGADEVVVDDLIQGRYVQPLAAYCGDFVVRRADRVYAYHLAVVVDDAAAGVTQVTRGADLLESTPRQIHLQRLLGLPTPVYAHLPLVLDAHGDKLSKQTRARPIGAADAAQAVFHALAFLGLAVPVVARGARPVELLAWALPRWCLDHIRPAPRPYRYPDCSGVG